MKVRESSVNVNGIELFYRQVGEGVPLVMLHGFFRSGALWEPYFEDLTRDFRLIVPDLRGHGRSTNPSGEFSHRQSALDIFALLNHLEIAHFRAVGFSSGAKTLLHMVTSQPARIEALSLWGATSYFSEQSRTFERNYKTQEADRLKWLQKMREIHANGDAQALALLQQFHAMADHYGDMDFTPDRLARISTPTLIVHGDREQVHPLQIAVDMYQAIPNAYLWVLPNTNHNVFGGFQRYWPSDRKPPSQQPFPPVVRAFLKNARF